MASCCGCPDVAKAAALAVGPPGGGLAGAPAVGGPGGAPTVTLAQIQALLVPIHQQLQQNNVQQGQLQQQQQQTNIYLGQLDVRLHSLQTNVYVCDRC